jgi:hypothetical protein
MSQTQWTAVRVSRDTKAKLEKLKELWTDLAHRTDDQLGSSATRSGQVSKRDEVGCDQVIRRLIILWERHQARSKKAATKRRIARLQNQESPSEEG